MFTPERGPIALFPTNDNENLICLYETDLTIALFAIEVGQNARNRPFSPAALFTSAPPIVRSTTLALRRCTDDEIASLKEYIQSVDTQTLRSLCVTGLPYPSNPSRQFLLTTVQHVTSPDRVPSAGEIPEVRPR
jgi:hypothetical protein